jgi:class 3 adenylate cyclase
VTADSPGGILLGGERKLVALVFADLSGYTALAASLDPEEVFAFVRPGLEAMQRIVEEHGGSVPHVMGDGFMAVFAVPAAHEDDAERAVRAALAVRDRARALSRGPSGIRFPEVHAGVNSGEVMGAVGRPRRAVHPQRHRERGRPPRRPRPGRGGAGGRGDQASDRARHPVRARPRLPGQGQAQADRGL